MGTNVPQPTFGLTGFTTPPDSAILLGRQADWQSAFGGTLNFTNVGTPQSQMVTSETAIISAAFTTFQYFTNQVDPAYAQGRMQDAIGRIYFIERLPALPTLLQVLCTGLANVPIPFGALVVDQQGNQFSCTQNNGGKIGAGGTVTLPFTALNAGPIALPSVLTPSPAIGGWDIAAVASGVVGQNVESRTAFELRRQQSVAQNSVGSLPAVLGSILNVDGVLDAYVIDNSTNAPVSIGGITLGANSIYVAAIGGTAAAVALALWKKKAPGCPYYSSANTTVVVTDPSPIYNTPPTYSVKFEIPPALPIIFAVNLATSTQVPANAASLVQTAIASAFVGGDGGPRQRIGTTVYATRYVSAVAALGPWAQVRSIQVGSAGAPASAVVTLTGVIAGTVLTASAVTGVLAVGQVITGASVPDGTMIISLGSGTGGAGTYNLNQTLAISSEAMSAWAANANTATVNINQVPTINTNDIYVTVT